MVASHCHAVRVCSSRLQGTANRTLLRLLLLLGAAAHLVVMAAGDGDDVGLFSPQCRSLHVPYSRSWPPDQVSVRALRTALRRCRHSRSSLKPRLAYLQTMHLVVSRA